MDDSWALITRGKPDVVRFEHAAVKAAQAAVTRTWPDHLIDENLLAALPPAISLRAVQSDAGGDPAGTAVTVFTELTKLGVIRLLTDQQFDIVKKVHGQAGSPVGDDETQAWYEVNANVLGTLYPTKL